MHLEHRPLQLAGLYYGLALSWSALFGLIPLFGPVAFPEVPAPAWFTIAGIPTMFGPLVAAWVVGRRAGIGFLDATGLRLKPNRWWAIAWFVPAIFMGAVLLAAAVLPEVSLATPLEAMRGRYGGQMPPEALAEAETALSALPPFVVGFGALLSGLVAGATVNGLAAFGEEAGWRGFLPRVLADVPFWPAALGTGALWGFWHAPLVLQGYNFPEAPVGGLVMMMVACALLTPPMLWLAGRGRSSVAAALFHGSLNGLAGIPFLFTVGGSSLLMSPLGLAGVLVLLPIDLALVWAVRPGARMRDVVPLEPARGPTGTPPATPA